LKYAEPNITFLEFVFKKLNFTMVLSSPQPISSDYVSSIGVKLQDVVLSYFNLAIGEIPLMDKIAEYADYTVSHSSYHAVWFVPCGSHESRATTISRIFCVRLDYNNSFTFCSKYINGVYGSIPQEE
jgi:hypothetical protein